LAFAEHGITAPKVLHEPRAERPQNENRQLRSQRCRHEALGKRLLTTFKPDGRNAGMLDVTPAGALFTERTPRSTVAFGPKPTPVGCTNAAAQLSHCLHLLQLQNQEIDGILQRGTEPSLRKNVSGLGEAFEQTTFILRRKADQFHKSVYIIQIFTTYEMSE
jgi:hypothetical protein